MPHEYTAKGIKGIGEDFDQDYAKESQGGLQRIYEACQSLQIDCLPDGIKLEWKRMIRKFASCLPVN